MSTFNPRKVRPAPAINRFRGLSVKALGPKLNNAYVGNLENFRSVRLREMGLREGQARNGESFDGTIHTARTYPDGYRLLSEGGNVHFQQAIPSRYNQSVGEYTVTPYAPTLDFPWQQVPDYSTGVPYLTTEFPKDFPYLGDAKGAEASPPAPSDPYQEGPSRGRTRKPKKKTLTADDLPAIYLFINRGTLAVAVEGAASYEDCGAALNSAEPEYSGGSFVSYETFSPASMSITGSGEDYDGLKLGYRINYTYITELNLLSYRDLGYTRATFYLNDVDAEGGFTAHPLPSMKVTGYTISNGRDFFDRTSPGANVHAMGSVSACYVELT